MWKASDSQMWVRYLERCISWNSQPKDLVIFESIRHTVEVFTTAIKDKSIKKQFSPIVGHSRAVLNCQSLSLSGRRGVRSTLSRYLLSHKS